MWPTFFQNKIIKIIPHRSDLLVSEIIIYHQTVGVSNSFFQTLENFIQGVRGRPDIHRILSMIMIPGKTVNIRAIISLQTVQYYLWRKCIGYLFHHCKTQPELTDLISYDRTSCTLSQEA